MQWKRIKEKEHITYKIEERLQIFEKTGKVQNFSANMLCPTKQRRGRKKKVSCMKLDHHCMAFSGTDACFPVLQTKSSNRCSYKTTGNGEEEKQAESRVRQTGGASSWSIKTPVNWSVSWLAKWSVAPFRAPRAQMVKNVGLSFQKTNQLTANARDNRKVVPMRWHHQCVPEQRMGREREK